MKCELLVVGATASAIGIALKQKCVIIEKTQMAVSEFLNSYTVCDGFNADFVTVESKKIKEYMQKRNLIFGDGGKVYSAAPVFNNIIKENNLNVLLDTDIKSIEKTEYGYKVTIYNRGGYDVIETKKIVDTTTESITITKDKRVPLLERSLNLLVANPDNIPLPDRIHDDIEFFKNPGSNDFIMKFYTKERLQKARNQVIDIWQSRDSIYRNLKIISIAFCIDGKPAEPFKKVDNNHYLMTSSYYPNPLAAIDSGYLQKNIKEED